MHCKRLFVTAHIPAANLWVSINARFVVGLLVLVICAPSSSAHAQYCNPATVSLIVRDERGKALTEAELKSVAAQLPKSIGDAQIYVGETSFAADGKTFNWPESVAWAQGQKVSSLQFSNSSTCTMQLGEVTLTHHDKKMRLIFNLKIARQQPDRRWVIDSLPFQEGTFVLDLRGWSHSTDEMIPAGRWMAVPSLTRGQ